MAIYSIDTTSPPTLDWTAKGTDRVVQNVLNILNTFKGEVYYTRNLGISPDIIDKDVETARAIIVQDLAEQIELAEPRATILSIDVVDVGDDGEIAVKIEIEV